MRARVVQFLMWTAFVYAVVCLCQSLIIPVQNAGYIDNVLYPFAFAHFVIALYQFKSVRLSSIAFISFFIYSLAINFVNKGSDGMLSDLAYQMYFLKWPVVLTSLYVFFKQKSDNFNIHQLILSIFCVLVVLNLFMVIDPFGLGELLQNTYSTKPLTNFYYYHEHGAYRMSGTQMNPNENAMIFALFFLYFMKFEPRWYYLLVAGGMLFLCQSRTAIILIGFLIVVSILTEMLKSKSKIQLIKFGFAMAVIIGLGSVFSTNFRSIINGQAFQSNSILQRYSNFTQAIESEGTSFWFGKGVVSDPLAEFGVYMDAEVVALLIQYGVIGVLLWFMILLIPMFYNRTGNWWNNFGFSTGILTLGICLTNYVYFNPTLGCIVAPFIVLVFIQAEQLKNNTPENKKQKNT